MPIESCNIEVLKKSWEKEQLQLRDCLMLEDPPWLADRLTAEDLLVGGLDVSFSKVYDNLAVATLTVVDMRTLSLLHEVSEQVRLTLPYIPNFLAYREVDAFQHLYETLKDDKPSLMPNVLMVDGNGTLHPRGFGSACLVGHKLNCPTIGVAKNLLDTTNHCGEDASMVRDSECSSGSSPLSASKRRLETRQQLTNAGDRLPIFNAMGEVCGLALLNSSKSKNPVYVSPGDHISLETACDIVLRLSKFRTPEPIRMADQISRRKVKIIDDLQLQA